MLTASISSEPVPIGTNTLTFAPAMAATTLLRNERGRLVAELRPNTANPAGLARATPLIIEGKQIPFGRADLDQRGCTALLRAAVPFNQVLVDKNKCCLQIKETTTRSPHIQMMSGQMKEKHIIVLIGKEGGAETERKTTQWQHE